MTQRSQPTLRFHRGLAAHHRSRCQPEIYRTRGRDEVLEWTVEPIEQHHWEGVILQLHGDPRAACGEDIRGVREQSCHRARRGVPRYAGEGLGGRRSCV